MPWPDGAQGRRWRRSLPRRHHPSGLRLGCLLVKNSQLKVKVPCGGSPLLATGAASSPHYDSKSDEVLLKKLKSNGVALHFSWQALDRFEGARGPCTRRSRTWMHRMPTPRGCEKKLKSSRVALRPDLACTGVGQPASSASDECRDVSRC